MRTNRGVQAPQGVLLGLLLVVLAAGVPVHSHADHEGEDLHVGAPEHGHGVVIVQQDMRAERPTPPVVVWHNPVGPALALPPLRRLAPLQQEMSWFESRAPPTALPRAPPLIS